MSQADQPRTPLDRGLFLATLALVVLGLWMVADTSFVNSLDSPRLGNDPFYFFKKQLVGAGVGIVCLLGLMRFGYWRLRPFAVGIMFAGLLALILVFLPKVGVNRLHAVRWIGLGPVQFQPSEFAKLTLMVYLAAVISLRHHRIRHLTAGLAAPLCVIGAYVVLIEREPDLGTAVVVFLASISLLYLAGARLRHMSLICVSAVLLALVFAFSFGHRSGRITAWLHPDHDPQGSGFQVRHSLQAIGSGGLLGVGIGEGKGKLFLTQANSDFIFATLAEELGFLRTLAVMGLLGFVGWRGFRIAAQTRDRFGYLLAAGITAIISWQAIINIAVATATIPTTGVPLPFISFGSSSLIFLLACVGLLLNIGQYPTPPPVNRPARTAPDAAVRLRARRDSGVLTRPSQAQNS